MPAEALLDAGIFQDASASLHHGHLWHDVQPPAACGVKQDSAKAHAIL